jgi:uncharacterized repeat protein (TIGR04076 family)
VCLEFWEAKAKGGYVMAFIVKATLVQFMGDEERFPCHFGYKIGDSFIYDGAEFHGRVCPGLLGPMVTTLVGIRLAGNNFSRGIPFRYAGLSARDESMKRYDGLGFRPLRNPPEGAQPQHLLGLPSEPPTERGFGWTFVCGDSRTSAFFFCEPVDIAARGYDTPFYRRSMAMLEKIKKQPGITIAQILEKFTEWERNEIYPPLTDLVAECLLDEMVMVNYLEVHDQKYYPLERALEKE